MPKTVPRFFAKRTAGTLQTRSSLANVGYLPGPWTQAGVLVTPETAMNYAAVFAAIFIISTDCAILPTLVYEWQPGGGKVVKTDHPLNELLQVEGNGEVDAIHLVQSWFADALRQGTGYLEILRGRDGRPVNLFRIDPSDIEPIRNGAGRLLYKLSNGKLLLPENLLVLKGLSRDGISGLSIVGHARQTIGLGSAADITAAGMFGNGINVSGFLQTPKTLLPEAQDALKAELAAQHGGPFNAGRPGLLVGDYKWIQMGLSPGDGQFLATRAFNVVEIARWFNINPIKLMDFTNGRFSNIEQAQMDHVTTTLVPWLTFAEVELNRKLLTRDDRKRYLIKHDVDARLRGDSASRWSNYAKGFAIGCLSRNEIRIKEDMNPVPSGDEFYLPVNNVAEVGQARTDSSEDDPSAENPGTDAPATAPARTGDDPIRDPLKIPNPSVRSLAVLDAALASF